MLEPPEILHTEEQLTAVIHLTIPRSEIRNVMAPGLAEIKAALAAQGIASTGPWMAHHITTHPDIFDFEICVPVAAPITASGRVQPSRWPAMRVARTVYQGDFIHLRNAWAEFGDWIKAHGHTGAPDLWECYLVTPDINPDPASWRAELNRELIR